MRWVASTMNVVSTKGVWRVEKRALRVQTVSPMAGLSTYIDISFDVVLRYVFMVVLETRNSLYRITRHSHPFS